MRAALFLVLACALLAGCGGSGSDEGGATGSTTETTAAAGTLEALWRAPGEDVAIVPGTSDYGPGRNRVSFLVVDSRSKVVASPTARVWVARGLQEPPFTEATAHLEHIGVPGGSKADATELYVVDLDLPQAGRYWVLAEPVDADEAIQALGQLDVKARTTAPSVGDKAIPSRTPTLRSTGGSLRELSTATPPCFGIGRMRCAVARRTSVPLPYSICAMSCGASDPTTWLPTVPTTRRCSSPSSNVSASLS